MTEKKVLTEAELDQIRLNKMVDNYAKATKQNDLSSEQAIEDFKITEEESVVIVKSENGKLVIEKKDKENI